MSTRTMGQGAVEKPPCVSKDDYECTGCQLYSTSWCFWVNPAGPDLARGIPLTSGVAIALAERSNSTDRNQLFLGDGQATKEDRLKAIEVELAVHGVPLHYTLLTRMLQGRYPRLNFRPRQVGSLLRASLNATEIGGGIFRSRQERSQEILEERTVLVGQYGSSASSERQIDETVFELYRKEAGREPLLKPAEEVQLSKAIEVGVAADWCLHHSHAARELFKEVEDRLMELRPARCEHDREAIAWCTQACERLHEVAVAEGFVRSEGSFPQWPQAAKYSVITALLQVKEMSKRMLVAQGRDSRQRMIEANTRLVISAALRISWREQVLDLIQEGNLGLMTAVERWDWRRGNKLSTYATHWINQRMRRYVQDFARTIRLPVHVYEQPGHDSAPYPHQIPVSLDGLASELPVPALEELIEDSEDDIELSQDVLAEELRVEIRRVLDTLTYRERKVMELRCGLNDEEGPRTLEEIGSIFSVTRERIRQIEEKAVRKLRHPSRSQCLRPFLDNLPSRRVTKQAADEENSEVDTDEVVLRVPSAAKVQ